MKRAIFAIAAAGLLTTACASDPYGYGGTNETVRQGATGAAIGAVAGAIIGNNVGDGSAGTGAAIGAVVGGAAGAIRGSNLKSEGEGGLSVRRGRLFLLG